MSASTTTPTRSADPTFQTAIRNSLYYALVWVPLTMVLGLSLALIVNQKLRGQTFFRAAYYFPAIASSAAITTIWLFIMAPDGLFNDVRAALGLDPLFELFGFAPHQNWIGDQDTAMNTVIVLNAWTTSGTFMLFYLASLQSISSEIYEAAAIDGASWWQAFWRVTMPLLRPGHYFVLTVAVIGALQMFDQAIIGGGVNGDPNNALMTVVLYLYNRCLPPVRLQLRGRHRHHPVRPHHERDARAATLPRRRSRVVARWP